jgi:hypothetical protein
MVWRSMDSCPKKKPFGVVTQAGQSYIVDVNERGKFCYRGPWKTEHGKYKARNDPPIFWWYGPLPILPADVDRIFARIRHA